MRITAAAQMNVAARRPWPRNRHVRTRNPETRDDRDRRPNDDPHSVRGRRRNVGHTRRLKPIVVCMNQHSGKDVEQGSKPHQRKSDACGQDGGHQQ